MQRSGRDFKLTPEGLRNYLREPIKAYKLEASAPAEKIRKVAQATADRIEAMCILYHIPADWPDDIQWESLARHLAGELFAGCKTLDRGRGGPRAATMASRRELQQALFEHFEVAKQGRPGRSDNAVAIDFLKLTSSRRKECRAAGLREAKSLAQAMRALRKEKGS